MVSIICIKVHQQVPYSRMNTYTEFFLSVYASGILTEKLNPGWLWKRFSKGKVVPKTRSSLWDSNPLIMAVMVANTPWTAQTFLFFIRGSLLYLL